MIVFVEVLSLPVQTTEYPTMIPFLSLTSGRFQERVTFLPPMLTIMKESGGAVGADNNVQ